jgi:hypothetical protein
MSNSGNAIKLNENDGDDKLNLVYSLKKNVERIFNLDLTDDDEDLKYCFKALIFDDYVFNILSPILKVNIRRKYFMIFYFIIKFYLITIYTII